MIQSQEDNLMSQFRSLVKARGWTVDEVRDLLRAGVLAHDPPCYATVANWCHGNKYPSGSRVLPLLTFIKTHSRHKHDGPILSKTKSVKHKAKKK